MMFRNSIQHYFLKVIEYNNKYTSYLVEAEVAEMAVMVDTIHREGMEIKHQQIPVVVTKTTASHQKNTIGSYLLLRLSKASSGL
jgi:hypothetical protein